MRFASNHLSKINKSRQRRKETEIFPRRILHTARPGMTGMRNNKGEGGQNRTRAQGSQEEKAQGCCR